MISIPSRFNGIDIPANDPFSEEKLGYKQYAPILKGMVDMYKDTGCVLAVNGKWGTGKTTFMQMWRASLPIELYTTIYFNAWETDYFSDPLIAILGELQEISQDNETFKSVCAAIGKVAVAAGGTALKGIIKKTTGVDADVVKDSVDAVNSLMQSSLADYKEQKQSIIEFKKKLSEYVANQDGKTVVFIVDELDRCNPHFAVKVLEIVKHLFDVPNICFILAIDKTQLECSIKGFYGNNEIDASNYLRRFIDIEFKMPQQELKDFTELLFANYHFDNYFEGARNSSGPSEDYFKNFATSLASQQQIDLRTYDKIMAHTRLALQQLGNDPVLIDVVFFLCFLRVTNAELFDAIAAHKFSVQELLTKFEDTLPRTLLVKTGSGNEKRAAHTMIFTIGQLLILYDSKEGETIEGCFNDIAKQTTLPLNCKLMDQDALLESLKHYKNQASLYYGISSVLHTVNLLRQFK